LPTSNFLSAFASALMPNALAVLNACVSALITLLLIGLLEALLNNGNDLDLTLFKLDLNFLS
jgi:hypothetical protein